MNIAVYYGLPLGGALRTMEEILRLIKVDHNVTEYHDPKIAYPHNRFFNDLNSILFQKLAQKKLAEEIDSQNFDLVFVTHDPHLQAPWILRFLKTPTVFLCQEPTRSFFEKFLDVDKKLPPHKYFYEKLNRTLRKNAEIENAQYAIKTISNSYYSSESIFRSYGTLSTPIHLGIDRQVYFPEKTTKKNQLLVVGNNEPQKDLPYSIKAVSLIPSKIRPTLIIASARDQGNTSVKKLAKKLKVNLKIQTGLDRSAMRKLYNQSLATLAFAHLEPFGLSPIESIACGTPVIAVNEAGFRETVTDGITGILTPRDIKESAIAIEKYLTDKTLREKLEKNCLERIKDLPTWTGFVQQLEKVFHETAKNRCHYC